MKLEKSVITRVISFFQILKHIVLRQTDPSFEGGRGECAAAPLNCTQMEGKGGEGCILAQRQAAGIPCTQASLNSPVLGGSVGVDYCQLKSS